MLINLYLWNNKIIFLVLKSVKKQYIEEQNDGSNKDTKLKRLEGIFKKTFNYVIMLKIIYRWLI